MRRFFIGQRKDGEDLLWLSAEESRHAGKVLRCGVGEKIRVFDSTGHEFEAIIERKDARGRVQIRVGESQIENEDFVSIFLIQGYMQKSKMDWIVEKTCEIGIHSFIPVESEYSNVHLKSEAAEKVKERWERIVTQAAKQSGNIRFPRIENVQNFEQGLERISEWDLAFLFHPGPHDLNLKEAVEEAGWRPRPIKLGLWVGPEGGFSENEVKKAKAKGVRVVQLGQNILRAETAAIVLTAIFKLL